MVKREDIDTLFTELREEYYEAIEFEFGYEPFNIKDKLLGEPNLITINHISLLERISQNYGLEHLTSHIYNHEYIGIEGTDSKDYTEAEINLLPKITLSDVRKIAANIKGTLDFLSYCFVMDDWEDEVSKLAQEEVEYFDLFEFNQSLFEYYLDDQYAISRYDVETGTFTRFNFKEFTTFGYLCYRRFNQDAQEAVEFYKEYLDSLDQDEDDDSFRIYNEKMLESEELLHEAFRMPSYKHDEKINEMIERDRQSLIEQSSDIALEAIYEFYLNRKELWEEVFLEDN